MAAGIFAQRAEARPNRIGVSVCRLLGVDGPEVRVHALDAIDGSPVLGRLLTARRGHPCA